MVLLRTSATIGYHSALVHHHRNSDRFPGAPKGPPEYCQDGTFTHLNYDRLLYNNRNSDRALEAPKGPLEYCQDGTVTHLSYSRLL